MSVALIVLATLLGLAAARRSPWLLGSGEASLNEPVTTSDDVS